MKRSSLIAVLAIGCSFDTAAGGNVDGGDGSGATSSPVDIDPPPNATTTTGATASADGTTDGPPDPTATSGTSESSATGTGPSDPSSTSSPTPDTDGPGPIGTDSGGCELLWWSADFSVDPTTLDVNGDGVADWAMRDDGAFDATELADGRWTATQSRPLDSRPLDDFTLRTLVEVRMRALTEGGNGAVMWINVDYGATFSPIWISVTLDGKGGQTLTLRGKTDNATNIDLHQVTGLGPGFVEATVDIDPVADEVQLWVDGTFEGTFAFPSFAVGGNDDRWVTLLDWTGEAEFDRIDVSQCF